MTERSASTGRALTAGIILAVAILLALVPAAQADRAFAVRYTTNTTGDILMAGNAITTCVDSPACTTARNGPGVNNDFVGRYIDVDTTDGRPSSSRATLTVPNGATVLFAGLYWGGYSGSATAPANAGTVYLDTPATATYQQLTASQLDRVGTEAYQGFADVTSLVQAGGSGVYTAADVKVTLGGGTNRYGGWSLVVVYRDGAEPPRNLTVFDGFVSVSASNPSTSIALSGFQTPPAGPVNTRLGVAAYDGDRGPGAIYTGDALRLDNTVVSDALNPPANFFNSSITRLGTAVTTRDPSYDNTLGYDSDVVDASGILANGATSATIGLTSAGETYSPGVVTFATELFAPRISPTKTVVDINGGDVEQGDILEYRIAGTNTGQDTASQLRLADAIPTWSTYVAGTLQQQAPGGTLGARTDATDADSAEYVAGTTTIAARLGTGTTSRLLPGASFELRFRVRVNTDLTPATVVRNQGQLNFLGEQTGRVFSNISTPLVESTVRSPDLALAKTHTGTPVRGGRVVYQLTVANAGDGRTRGTTTVTDTLPAGLVADGVPSGTGWTCTLTNRVVGCSRSDVLAAGASFPVISVPTRVAQTAPESLINGASVDTPGDANASNDAATDPLGASSNADLAVTKTASSATAAVGQSLTFTLGVRNAGPTDATGVTLADTLPAGLVPAAAPGCTISGQSVTCAIGALASGASASRTVTATVTMAGAGRTLDNTVTGIGNEPDLNASDNTATASVTVAPEADLHLEKAIAPSPLVSGGPVRFTLTLRNDGPSPATNVVVADPIPLGVGGVTLTTDPAGATCAVTAGTASCTFARVEAGATVRVEIAGTLAAAGGPARTLSNTATASGAERDPDPADNTATAAAPLTESADLRLAKTAAPASVRAGEQITYTLALENRGPSVARATVLTDRLPAAIAPGPAPAGCTLVAGLLTCPLGDLAPGATRTVQVGGTVAAGFTGPLENTAEAVTATPDPDGARAAITTPVSAVADLVTTKSASAPVVAAGDDVTFTVTVRNAGPSVAASARLVDTLPAGLEPRSATPAAGCSTSGQVVTCALGDLAPNATATVTVVARVAPGQGAGTLENVAEASSAATDPVPGDNIGRAAIGVSPQADLELAKRAAPSPASAGERLTFTVDVANRGPSVARDVTVSDPLPAELTALQLAGDDCTLAGQTVTCAYGDLAPGATRSFQVSGLVPAGFSGTLSNAATVASTTTDPDPSDNRAAVDVPVTRTADVAIAKRVEPATVTAGGPVTYTLQIENRGPGVADAVTVADAVPATVQIATVTPAACTRTLQDVACAFGALAPGATRTVTITGTIDPAFAGRLENRATVSSPTPDPVPGNNTDVAVSDATARADLSIAKTAPAQARAGEPIAYTLTVANAGPSDAVGVSVRDALPDGIVFAAVEPAGSCSGGAVVTCALGLVPAGATRTVTISGTVDPAAAAGPRTNTATTDSDTVDPDAGDRTASATTEIVSEADVGVTKTATPDPVTAGETISYAIRVANGGPAVARDVVLTDPVPGAIAVSSVDPEPACALGAGNQVRCAFGDLPPGTSREITIVGTVAAGAGGTLTNTATATTATADPVPGNDAATAVTGVTARAALALTKTAAPARAVAGEPLTWTLQLTNGGPSAAEDVHVVDPVPADVAVTSVSAPCTATGQDVVCAFGTLPAGATREITITGTVGAGATGTLRNTATASTITPGPNPVTAVAETPVDTSVALGLVKTVDRSPVAAGEEVAFTLTASNAGPSRAVAATLSDELPPGVAFLAADPPANCTSEGSLVTCVLGDLDPGDDQVVTIRARVDAAAAGGLRVNHATLASPSAPGAPAEAEAPFTVDRSADVRLDKTATPDPATAGEALAYVLTATNDGPSTAEAVVIRDTLPAGVALAGPPPTGCSVAGALVTCALGTLGPGTSAGVRLETTVAPGAAGPLQNVAVASSSTGDPVPGNNTAQTTTPLRFRADLSVAKVADPATATAGAPLTYRITVNNAGPSVARAATIDDALPDGFTVTPPLPAGCEATGGRVQCALGDLAPGETREIALAGAVAPTQIAALENTVAVASDTPDDAPADNQATITTPVAVAADLELTKVAEAPSAIAGTTTAWLLTLTNRGPATATGVTLHDRLPEGATVATVTPGGTCVGAGRDVDCAFGDLAPTDSVTVRVVASIAPDVLGELRNAATADAATPDPDAANNSASAPVPVTARTNVRITKRAQSPDVVAGADLTYRLRVVNDGPSVARTVVVTDRLPAGLTTPISAPGCTVTGLDLACVLGTLAPGEERVLDVTARVGPAVGADDEIVNTATVSTSTPDADPSDDSDTETVNAVARADLQVTKSGPAAAGAGDAVAYVVTVTNAGPSDAAGVSLADTLPAELDDVTFTPATTDCSIDGRRAGCLIGLLPAGESRSFTITGTIDPDTPAGTIVNRAEVDADTSDPEPGNNAAEVPTVVSSVADVAVTKTAEPAGPVTAGAPLTYTITVANLGPATARGVTMEDTLPAGVSLLSADPPACTGAATVTCALGDLRPGDDVTITLTTRVDPATLGTLTNTATVTATNDPGPDANDRATAENVAGASADLSIAKSVTPSPLVPGEPATYVLRVTNDGLSTATGVVVRDLMPAALAGATVADDGGAECTLAGGALACTLAALAPGTPLEIRVLAPVAPGTTGDVTNTATVAADTPDPDPDDNAASLTTPVAPRASLSLAKSAAPGALRAGERVTFTLTARNGGPSAAQDVVIRDTLPDGLTAVLPLPAGCTATGQEIACTVGTLAAGADAERVIAADVDPAARGTLRNTAVVTSPTPDDEPSDDSAAADVTVTGEADLGVTKTVDPAQARAGELVTYTLTVTNGGPSTAVAAMLADTARAGLAFQDVAPAAGCDVSAATLQCALGDLAPGASRTFTLTARIDPAATGDLVNAATVATDTSDPNPANDTASATVTASPSADVALTKTATQAAVAGTAFAYTITARNLGPSLARDVVVTDTVPDAVAVETVTPDAACDLDGQAVTCTFAALPPGEDRQIVIAGTLAAAFTGPLENTATATAATPDPDPANNAATARSDVSARADLTITKTADPEVVLVGQTATFRLVVTNAGPSAAANVAVLDDQIDAALEVVSATPSQGACADRIRCELGTLAPGGRATVDIVVRPGPAAADGTFRNTARVGSDAADPTPGDNVASATLQVRRAADLALTKTITPDQPTAGAPLTYTLTARNDGPGSATGVEITDELPAALLVTGIRPVPDGAVCGIEPPNLLRCTFDAVAPGESVTVAIDGELPRTASGRLVNTATVAANEGDPDLSDNTATVDREIAPPAPEPADLSVVKTGPATAVAGGGVSWAINVANAGPGPSSGVVVTDTLPAGTAFVRADPSQGTCAEANGTVRCELGTLASGATTQITLAVSLANVAAGAMLTNRATVDGAAPDPQPANDQSEATTQVVAGTPAPVQLDVAKRQLNAAQVGQPLRYEIEVRNLGLTEATDVVVTDRLPPIVRFESAVATQGACTGGTTVVCRLGTLAPGASAVVTVTVTPLVAGAVRNQASVTAGQLIGSADDQSSALGTAQVSGGLRIRKTASRTQARPGQIVRYTMRVRNRATVRARALTLCDTLPARTTFVRARGGRSAPAGCAGRGRGWAAGGRGRSRSWRGSTPTRAAARSATWPASAPRTWRRGATTPARASWASRARTGAG